MDTWIQGYSDEGVKRVMDTGMHRWYKWIQGMHGYRDTAYTWIQGLHGYRDIGIKGYMDTGIHRYKDTWIQSIHVCRDPGIQGIHK